jgi:formate hydrogenlyase subunit 3/multisubunit Na+/H+ antiporter MnhD subunit
MDYAIFFLLLPLFAAFLAPVGGLLWKRFGAVLNLAVYAAGIAFGLWIFRALGPINPTRPAGHSVVLGGWQPPYGINLYLSRFSVGFGLVMYLIALLVHVYDLNRERSSRFNLLFGLFVFASIGMVLTGDLFNLFIFIEIGGIAVIALSPAVSLRSGTRGAVKYLVPSGFLSMLMLASIALLYSSLGTLNIADIASKPPLNGALGLVLGVGVLGVVFFEAELFPFNSWVPDVYKGAPTSFSAAVAGIGGLAGAAVLGRLFLTMMGDSTTFAFARGRLAGVVFAVAAASMVIGEIAALRERDIKKLLAFSSVGQMGMAVLAFTVGGDAGIFAGLFLLLNHTLVKPMLLMLAGFFIRKTGSSRWDEMGGAARRNPLQGALFVLGGLSLMGMPVFGGFWGKLTLLKSLFDRPSTLPMVGAALLLFSTVIEGIYFLRIGHSLFESDTAVQDRPPKGRRERADAALTLAPAFILALFTLLLGVQPGLVSGVLQSAAADLTDSARYIRNVLFTISKLGGGL